MLQKQPRLWEYFSTIKNRGTCWPSTAAKIAKGLGVEVEEILESEE